MIRQRLTDSLKQAMKERDDRTVRTIRLILAALKDRDIAVRTKTGRQDGLDDQEIVSLLQTMVKQRRESIALYEQGARVDLAEGEQAEIAIIERFLPQQMSDDQIREAVNAVIAEIGATGLKDMGRTMATLKSRHGGTMDFSKASGVAKAALSG
ncbi:GatB/YqeY domain-containing protein [Fodinicurvata sp. EGI_FJ10296]|uniref:GatB/YqeY domain-containing protein n=1 Tax=Fodinicurvata sp. EGI_FJ10296 TaxID=3231908 RepID=UPI003452DC98